MGRIREKLIDLVKVNKTYGFLKVLEDVSLHLFEGEIVSILGPSGCGKTTLLNIIAHLTLPEKGEVRVTKGKRIGYMFQEPRLIPWKNVEQNILFAQKNYLLRENIAQKLREQLIRKAKMEDFIHCFPSQLSGGMKQRVSLIRAFSIMPHILLLDEPFKSVDYKTVPVIEEIIREKCRKKQQGILMVTHDYREAMKLSSRVYIFSQRPAKIKEEIETGVPKLSNFSLSSWNHSLNLSNQELIKGVQAKVGKNNFRSPYMKLREVINSLKLQNLTPQLYTDVSITGCHISDVMSDALANASEGNLWITQQQHQVTIALAFLKRIPAVLLVNGKQPSPETIEKAKEEKIVILTTPLSCFEISGRLYQLGLTEKKTITKLTALN